MRRDDEYLLINADDPATTVGVELLGTWRRAPYAITGTSTYVVAREHEQEGEADSPLTPRHSVGIVPPRQEPAPG